jgi:nitrogen regulatory protein P-II 1
MKVRKSFILNKICVVMIKIEAIVRSSVLHKIQDALSEMGIPTFSAYQVQITGIHKAHEGWRNKTSDFIPKMKIEILCESKDEEKISNTIQKTATTGTKGDGIILVYNIDKLVKIKNGRTGANAL